MIVDKKIPSNYIQVVQVFKNEWQFQFPRLDERVYDMFHEALEEFEAGSLSKAEHSIRLLLEGFPEFIDAYHHLAMILNETRRFKEARQVWKSAVQIGLDAFPKTFNRNRHRLPWGLLDNRPFLRAYHSSGLQLLEEEKVEEALAVFKEILSLNPNDNQGIRGLAIDCHFRLHQPDKVLAICKHYPEDTMEQVLYGRPLALFQLDREPEARAALRNAVEILPNVARELLKRTHRPPKNLNPNYVTDGGADQAYFYWQQNGRHWIDTKGALVLLSSIFHK
jgi:tetratricopeptide (TPR) repeat protein